MKIMFNAGHGAGTSGKRSPDGKVREWAINDKVVNQLMIMAKEYEGLQVSRADDPTGKTDVSLAKRLKDAEKWGADLYCSIHQNASGNGVDWNDVTGSETFAYQSSSKEASRVAGYVQKEIIGQLGTKNRGVKYANFYELAKSPMPAILVECEFMTNKKSAEWMLSPGYGKQMARAIMDGLAKAYGLKKKASVKGTSKTTGREVDWMAEKYDPGSKALLEATEGVLKRLENAERNPLNKSWRDKLDKGELTNGQAIGLVYVAIERGIL